MRLLTVGNRYPPWSLGGYEVVWQEAVLGLRERGHAVRVLTTLPDPSDLPGPAGEDVHRELRWYWRAHRFPPMSRAEVLALERHNAVVLARQLRAFNPEAVLWSAMGGMSLSLIEQVRRAGLPALGLVGDDWMAYGPLVDLWIRRFRGVRGALAPLAERRFGLPARLPLGLAGRWAFNSRYLIERARAAGWRLPDTAILAPGVDEARFTFVAPGSWRWRLLVLGRLDERKGVETAVRALALLPAQARLRLHGPGEASVRERLVALAAELGVGDRLSFSLGAHGEVPEVLAECDAVLFPVHWEEPWGLVPLEAMAVGRPVVATRAGGGAAEYLRDGANCVACDPADPARLASAVRRLADDEALRGRLVSGGRETAARYTQRAFHDGVEAMLQELRGA